MKTWGVYMIRCHDESLYTGVAVDVEKRFLEHQSGGPKSAKYLRGRGPLKMVWSHQLKNRQSAHSLEYRLKQLPKETKEDLVEGRVKVDDVIEWV